MIDTIRLKSPYISEDLYKAIKENSLRRLCIVPDGSLMYEFTTKELSGSYDNRIMLKVQNEEWKKIFYPSENKWILSKVESKPYIEIEFSIHKFFLGHNVYGGSNDLKSMLDKFEIFLSDAIGLKIPCIRDWIILRLDYAEVFKIPFINDFISLMQNSNFPRRKVSRFHDETIYVSGSTTTLKFYKKYEELLAHDRKRLKSFDFFDDLVEYSKDILRVEVEIKKRKFEYDNGYLWTVEDFDIDYVINLYDVEVKKIMNLREENTLICDYVDVKKYLYENFSNTMARSLMATYSDLSLLGEKETKKSMTKSNYYKHRKLLIDNNISWENSNLRLKEKNKVLNFLPYRNSEYCIKLDCIEPILKKAI